MNFVRIPSYSDYWACIKGDSRIWKISGSIEKELYVLTNIQIRTNIYKQMKEDVS